MPILAAGFSQLDWMTVGRLPTISLFGSPPEEKPLNHEPNPREFLNTALKTSLETR